MRKLLRNGVSLLPIVFLASSPVYGDDTGLTQRSLRPSPRNGLRAEIGSGVGIFNGIVIPDNADPYLGTSEQKSVVTTSRHYGIPITLLGGWQGKSGAFRPAVDLSYSRISNLKYDGTDRQVNSGYSRWELDLEAGYWFTSYFGTSFKLISRRSFYKNHNDAHVLDSMMPGLGLTYRNRRWETGFVAYASVYSNFGFNQGSGLGSRSLGKTDSSVYGAEWENAYQLNRSSKLTFGVQQENARVTMFDTEKYQSYGFNISPIVPKERTFNLSTTIISLGFMKLL